MIKELGGSTKKTKITDPIRSKQKIQAVYFAACYLSTENTRIKIGYTRDLFQREKGHKSHNHGESVEFDYLCALKASAADESAIQRHFRPHAFNIDASNEYFHPHEDVVGYIRWLRDQYFVWVPDDPYCDSINDMDEVSSSLWFPSQDRVKAPPKSSLFSSGFGRLNLPPRELTEDDYYTNPIILDAARKTLGGIIDLDPASHAVANREVMANKFYTKADDGLSKEWYGNVWLNPPFSQWSLFVPKIVSEWDSGRIKQMCVLCAARTVTAQYFAKMIKRCCAMCILHGRIKFWGCRAGDNINDGHFIFYFGNDVSGFQRHFSEIGTTLINQQHDAI